MKQLWSPWRSAYIQSFKKKPRKRGAGRSLFTSAWKAHDDDGNLIVWRGERCFVIMNRYPYNSGHLMIVPYRQTPDIRDLTAEEMVEIMQTTQRAIRALDLVLKPQGYNFGANIGRASGAGVDDHVHFHLVPRWNGDTNFMAVLGDSKVISQDLRQTLKKLQKVF